MTIKYKKKPANTESEIHICFRCSDAYSAFILIPIFSILNNNKDAYVYIYIFTDTISEGRWSNILNVAKKFKNNEIIKIIPDPIDVHMLLNRSSNYHGWNLIHISIFYQKYLITINRIFNFGVDTFCVGSLLCILAQDNKKAHYIGSAGAHQNNKPAFSFSPLWIGFDASLINLQLMRDEGLSPDVLADYSISTVGYIHDEVAYNGVCRRQFIDSKYYYIYTGSHLPQKKMLPETVIVDFYNNLKPWDIAVKGYTVFDAYIEIYNEVSKLTHIEYVLPSTFYEASKKLILKGYPFIDWYPIRHPFIGRFIYRLALLLGILKSKLIKAVK
jgi:lipopolysaccharide biosynthesis glycosyltransferase